jgi:translation initiation factor 2 beta subunit (eIF-2beta)/eIF-5
MKNYLKILFILIINIFTIKIFAQSPEVFKYQAIVRNTSGEVLANQNVSFRISILKNNTSGTLVYEEIHTVTTNSFGLVNLNIGEGSVVSGSFSTINWANDKYFLQVELDPTGGTTYLSMGTSQLLSVPYALYAKSAGTVPDGWKITGNTGTIPWVNFIGTIDNKDFDVRTNNTLKWRFTTNGALEFLNTGNSVFIGESAGKNDDFSDNNNVFIGYAAGFSNTNGNYNIAIGSTALFSNTTGYGNIGIGGNALRSNIAGYENIGIGSEALRINIEGSENIAIGTAALHNNYSGSYNIAISNWSLYSNTEGYGNVAIGYKSLNYNTTGNLNVAIGAYALMSNINGCNNIAGGFQSLVLNIYGSNNTAYGYYSLYNDSTGSNNTAIGCQALFSNKTGINNTALGCNAFSSGNYNNSTAIGYNTNITASNQIRIGNNSITSIGGQVGWTTLSDLRFKKDVKENVPGLNFIMKLKPVTYYFDMDAIAKFTNTPDSMRLKDAEEIISKMLQTGFLAQDVEKVARECGFDFSGVDAPKNENDYYGLRYAEFVVPIVKAIQEQQGMIDNQQTIIDNQQKIINELKRDNENMKKELQELKQLIIENINK